MADGKWTPGPWTARRAAAPNDGEYDYGIGAEVDGRLQCIAEAFGRCGVTSFPPAEANANLIAAAPDLYEALVEARERMVGSSPGLKALIAKTDAALSRARGETA